MNPTGLIINADDLGFSPGINAGIDTLARVGALTSVSLSVTGPCPPENPRLYHDLGISVGLHFSLTFGVPVLSPDKIPTLVNHRGLFDPVPSAVLARLDPIETRAELLAQLEKFHSLTGDNPSHLDFHQHLHARSAWLQDLLLNLAKDLRVYLRALDGAARRRYHEAGVHVTDHFLGGVKPTPYWTPGRLLGELSRLPAGGLTELMCHPGKEVTPIEGVKYLSERETELATFLDPGCRALLLNNHPIPFPTLRPAR